MTDDEQDIEMRAVIATARRYTAAMADPAVAGELSALKAAIAAYRAGGPGSTADAMIAAAFDQLDAAIADRTR